jgi:thiamine biosynthesis lipoprotein
MTHGVWAGATLALIVTVLMPALATPGKPVVRDVYLMGTRARLVAWAPQRTEALATLDRALTILEATEAELSTWRDDSVISRLNRQGLGAPFELPRGLCDTFAVLYQWHAATAGTFDPAIGRITDAWGIHAGGRVPPDPILRDARLASGLDRLAFHRERCTITRRDDVRIDVGAFGKGDALDRVARAIGGEASWLIDLGGQVSVHGAAPTHKGWPVAIAYPHDRHREFLQLYLREGSLSTSAGSERDLEAEGRRIGHILDPRTGRPAAFDGSVTVWHRQGLVADLLSTALFVMGPDEGLRWAEARGLAACFLVPKANTVNARMTRAFLALSRN